MLVNGQRALAYIVNVDDVKPLEGYDKVETGDSWWVALCSREGHEAG